MTRLTVVDTDGTLPLDDPDGPQPATAEFSLDRKYRYALTRTWHAGTLPVAFVMLNPSVADAFIDDPTVAKCVQWAKEWGAGGLIVLNAFAWRDTNPKALLRVADPVGPDNDEAILDWLSRPLLTVVAAWGTNPAITADDNLRERQVAELISHSGHRPRCLKRTAAGHPGHPLYLRNASRLIPWTPPAEVAA